STTALPTSANRSPLVEIRINPAIYAYSPPHLSVVSLMKTLSLFSLFAFCYGRSLKSKNPFSASHRCVGFFFKISNSFLTNCINLFVVEGFFFVLQHKVQRIRRFTRWQFIPFIHVKYGNSLEQFALGTLGNPFQHTERDVGIYQK